MFSAYDVGQKREQKTCDGGGNSRRPFVDSPRDLVYACNDPIQQRRLGEVVLSIQGRDDEISGTQHFRGGGGALPFVRRHHILPPKLEKDSKGGEN